MTRRAVITGAVVTALILAFLFAPWTYATITGEPLYVDCGGLEATRCDDAWRSFAQQRDVTAPITWVEVKIWALDAGLFIPESGAICGDYTFGHWWPPLDIWATQFQPFC
jgi:hypothetical protein